MGTFCVCDLSFRSFVPNFVPDLLPSCPSWTLSPRCPSCKLVVVRPPPWQPPFPHCPHCPQRPKLSACPSRSTSSGANEKSTHSCVVVVAPELSTINLARGEFWSIIAPAAFCDQDQDHNFDFFSNTTTATISSAHTQSRL